VAGVGDFARSFRTNDNGEPDLLPSTHPETFAAVSGVSQDGVLLQIWVLTACRTIMRSLVVKMGPCASTQFHLGI
jgi:hypothetical protein